MKRAFALALVAACGQGSASTPPRPGGPTATDGGDAPAPDGPPPWLDVKGERLAPLPAQTYATSPHFETSDACAGCHSAQDGTALRDAKGRDVSPTTWWRPTMMALAARDPYYLAAFSHEIDAHAGAKSAVERTCTPCHAPEAVVELRLAGTHLAFADLTAGTSTEATLAREGIACTLCHQIRADGLGTRASFSGGYVIGDDRTLFGPHSGPDTNPMSLMVNYTPAFGAHIGTSAACATCHTVITRAIDASGASIGPEFLEQGAYLEWQDSDYVDEGTPGAKAMACQGCHVPTTDEDGASITTAIAVRPVGLAPRAPVGRHALIGANAYVLRLVADNRAWAGPLATADAIAAHADRTEAHLQTAAAVAVASAARAGARLDVKVTVENRAGHKFPTGHPSRRAWLHVKVSAGQNVVFESGRADAWGRLVDAAGHVLDHAGVVLPHRNEVASDAEVVVYESVAADARGAPVHTLLDAYSYAKDTRLLPSGWSASHANAAATRPFGTSGDADFGATDAVTFHVASAPAGPLSVDVELLYQSVKPAELEALAAAPTPASRRFFDMAAARLPAPLVVARAHAEVP